MAIVPVSVRDTATYDAYGEMTRSTGTTQNSYRFAGEQFDSNVGQYYLRARYYDAGVGRFGGRDPFEGDMTLPLSLAKYPYVHGNPVNATDPSGQFQLFEVATQAIRNALERAYQASSATSALVRVGSSTVAKAVSSAIVITPQAANITATIGVGVAVSVLFAMRLAELLVLLNVIEQIPGIPLVVWGNDIPKTTEHTYEALRGEGQTMLSRVGITGLAPSFLARRGDKANEDRSWLKYKYRTHCTEAKRIQYENIYGPAVCDEYPYASTWQGGRDRYDFTNRVSIKFVPSYEQMEGPQPNNQARMLKNFYLLGHVSAQNLLEGFFMVRANTDFAQSRGYGRSGNSFPLY